MHLMEKKRFFEKRREQKKANMDYERAILGKDRRRRIELLSSEGLLRVVFGEEKDGVKNLKKLANKTDEPQVLNDIGVGISSLGNHKEAAKVYERAVDGYLKKLEENPKDFDAHHEVALALQSLASSLHAVKSKKALKKKDIDRINGLFHDSIRHYKVAFSGDKNLKKKLILLEGMSIVMKKRGDFLSVHGSIDEAKLEWSRSKAAKETMGKILKRLDHSEPINQ